MNKTEFVQLITDPTLPGSTHVTSLKQVMADFPYFTAAHVLLAKALHNEQHYEYEKYLKQAALIAPDRDVLYHYIHQVPVTWSEPNIQPIFTHEVIADHPVDLQDTSTIKQPDVSEPLAEDQELSELNVSSTDGLDSPSPVKIFTDSIDEEVIHSSESFSVDLAIAELLNENQITTTETVSEVVSAEDVVVNEELIAAPEEVAGNEPPIVVNDTADANEVHSFLEWLNLKTTHPEPPADATEHHVVVEQPKPSLADSQEPQPDEKIEFKSIQTLPSAPVEVTKEEIEQAVAKSNVNDFHNILDKFIKENPSITRPKAEFFNPVNMAKQSVEEDEELVTETLANLYYKQGNHRKAIRAYEKLCLKYPSKLSYFANLIQKIKAEIKD